MTDVTTLRELLSRVENAAGPDRELDARLDAALFWGREFGKYPCHLGGHYELADGQVRWLMSDRKYTSSIDAAVALCERVLPRWRIRWQHDGDGVHMAFLENMGDFGAICADATESFCASGALALCAALLRAKIVMLDGTDGAPR